MRLCACLLFTLAACGSPTPTATDITLTGIPVDPNLVLQFVHAYTAFAAANTRPGPLDPNPVGTVDFRPASDFSSCALTNLLACPHESFGQGGGIPFIIVTEAPGSETGTDAYGAPDPYYAMRQTSLAHELTHAMFGDDHHARADLWGYWGLESTWNNHPEGRASFLGARLE